jgi:hypothetical protein
MASPNRSRKRIKKEVADGIVHVHASFNNTIITITIERAMLCLGQHLVVQVFEGQEKVHHLLHRSLLKKRALLRKNLG